MLYVFILKEYRRIIKQCLLRSIKNKIVCVLFIQHCGFCFKTNLFIFYCKRLQITFVFLWQVKEITRDFELVNGDLSYVVQMATNLTGIQPHLKALLKKL